jgi:uncharacterized Zn-binding protein involved in type VI secretion|tara:strand:+ start:246 stop:548 length:303 start_codon:yes stop_codon:yes gene_type:complete
MPAVSRKGDTTTTGHVCTGTTTLDTPGQGTCFANSILIARQTDPTVSHIHPPLPACPPHVANVNVGSPNVFVESKAIARIGDSTDSGALVNGSGNVFANG